MDCHATYPRYLSKPARCFTKHNGPSPTQICQNPGTSRGKLRAIPSLTFRVPLQAVALLDSFRLAHIRVCPAWGPCAGRTAWQYDWSGSRNWLPSQSKFSSLFLCADVQVQRPPFGHAYRVLKALRLSDTGRSCTDPRKGSVCFPNHRVSKKPICDHLLTHRSFALAPRFRIEILEKRMSEV